MNITAYVDQLVEYVESLPDFELHQWGDENGSIYQHMGATITDGILQAGIKYATVVELRVRRLLADHPDAVTTSGFLTLLNQHGAEQLLNFRGRKPQTVQAITQFFVERGIETETDLQAWLQDNNNRALFRAQKGIGPKTVDYFARLAGLQEIAVDVQLRGFLRQAGIETDNDYELAKAVIAGAADAMGIPRGMFDYSIWKYMSER